MAYTAKQRKQIHSALVRAVPCLWNGKGKQGNQKFYICNAISAVARYPDHWPAKIEIQRRLGRYNTVSLWLYNEAKIPHRLLTDKNLQVYRHRWLQSLIAEFSV